MQGETLIAAARGVAPLSHEWMAEGGKVSADLVGTPG